jgi:hypothetical protein
MLPPNQQQQQQQQQEGAFVVGKLCSVTTIAAGSQRDVNSDQLLPLQVPDSTGTTAVAASTTSGADPGLAVLSARTNAGLQQQQQQQQQGVAEPARLGMVRMFCGVTQGVRDLQVSTAACFSIVNPIQQQQQLQACCSSSSSQLMFLPSCCSISHIIKPGLALSSSSSGARSRHGKGSSTCASSSGSSSSSTFVGVQLQCLPLLVLAGLSQDKTLIAACTQNPAPLAAAAAAWRPSSGLPQQLQASLLWNIQAGVLDGVPVPAGEAPVLLLSVALQALVLGRKASVQREQLGSGEWPQGTNLVDSLLLAFPGVAAWREKLLQDARRDR